MTLPEYLTRIEIRFKSGITTEHSFRGDLQNLLESWLPDVLVTNEPTRIKCGAPDYILTRKDIPVGYIEAKDLAADLNSKGYQEQFNRYKESLTKLIITNYLDFQVYNEGSLVTSFSIGKIEGTRIVPTLTPPDAFKALLVDFSTPMGQTIRSSEKLALMMANKAILLGSVINQALLTDEKQNEDSTLHDQYKAFKEILIHEITIKEFADIYAQTIAYGMFAARVHDPTLQTFTRNEAAELIPKSNPFLRKLFQYIAGYDLDRRIVWIVDALADIFRATDVAALLKNFGNATQQDDPIIHFFETFLAEYDPKLRKARGVWFTPKPVVKYIVRAVNEILKTEFGLPAGLADISKTKIKTKAVTKATADKRSKLKTQEIEQEIHRVQILDPATGTGTFLAEIVEFIYTNNFKGQQGIWSNYVETHLMPRLNGFELLMASYAMAHLKLDLLLTETGYKATRDQRLRVYLTNSLEEHHPDTGTLFANWLSSEANEANHIKRDVPVMVVIGNPPYSVSSSNKSRWIEGLMSDYKTGLNENNIQPLSDDYIKFIRFGQFLVEKTGEGILAYISNNSFLSGVIHRKMRESLLEVYDQIYIIDLHGNSNLKERSPDGTKDENVFDIQQGVSINVFVKTSKTKTKTHAKVCHSDLFGARQGKYDALLSNDITFTQLKPVAPNYMFIPLNEDDRLNYDEGLALDKLFLEFGGGIQTKRDKLFLDDDQQVLHDRITRLLEGDLEASFIKAYNIADSSSYLLLNKIKRATFSKSFIRPISYFPFDSPYVYYDKDLIGRPFYNTMRHLLDGSNLGLVVPRQNKKTGGGFITNTIIGQKLFSAYDINYVFPLYIYPDQTPGLLAGSIVERVPNLNMTLVNQIVDRIHLPFAPTGSEQHSPKTKSKPHVTTSSFGPEDLLDYIYSVLFSPSFVAKYKEFLKIDFPRIPYPSNADAFWRLVKLGNELRGLHLFTSPALSKFLTQYPSDGSNVIEIVKFRDGNVWINENQQFTNVPLVAWDFYIGGYQPAQKWLKDRKGTVLSFTDILHYQKIIMALFETDRIMKQIDVEIISILSAKNT